MSTLLITLGMAFAVVIISLTLLGISWLLTGKSRLRIGMCGRVPKKGKEDNSGCGSDQSCSLCNPGADKKEI